MCGICGIVNLKKRPSRKILSSMNKTLIHRGPDQEGLFLDNKFALASRRLSIIDITEGRQPIFNQNKTCAIVYNGEVYNFQGLKNQLLKKGYHFKTNTDTETVLHLYESLGPNCVKQLNGMFAFAIADIKKEVLFLARDHFGIKPLYYYYQDGLFLFASELKAIIKHPKVKKNLDFEALNQYFSTGFGCIPAPRTIFKNIKKLSPAHYLIFKNNRIIIKKYWHLENTKKINISFSEAKERCRFLIEKSVKEQMMADQKIFGSFLSGGVDSSAIAAITSRLMAKKLKTFSIGFKDPSFDESYFAKKAARFINSEHHHQFLTSQKLLEILSKLAKKIDEPFADSSLLPTYLLSTFAGKYVKVAFSGDGGDELFGGYPTYQAHKAYSFYQKVPLFLRKNLIAPIIQSMPTSFSNISLDFKLKKFISGDHLDSSTRHLVWLAPFSLQKKGKLFTKNVIQKLNPIESTKKLFNKYFKAGKHFDTQDRLQYLDLKTYLGDFGLVKTDRASSLASLELRPPFLTAELTEFVFSLPSSFRLKGLTTKYLLKESVKDLLPKEIINRPKKGFGAPIAKWINKDLKLQVDQKLNKNRLKKQGIFNPEEVKEILQQHRSQKKNNRMKIWSLFMFQLWYDNFFK